MTATDGTQGPGRKTGSKRRKNSEQQSQDQRAAQAHLNAGADQDEADAESGFEDELAVDAQLDEEPDTIALVGEEADDAEDPADFDAEGDPDVAAVDKVLSVSRKQQTADSNSSIRRMLEERSEARRMRQDLDYLDFDD